jgi:hypothetical protein
MGVENVNLRLRDIQAISFRLREIEREVMFAPNHQQGRLLLADLCLLSGVGVDVRAGVVEQVALNSRLNQERHIESFINQDHLGPDVHPAVGQAANDTCALVL